jgi:hypothetical protein
MIFIGASFERLRIFFGNEEKKLEGVARCSI